MKRTRYEPPDSILFSITLLYPGPTQTSIQWVPGSLSLVVKRPGSEADHSPPTSTEVKFAWSYASAPPIPLPRYISLRSKYSLFHVLTLG